MSYPMARGEADFPEMPESDRPVKARKLSRVVKRPNGQRYEKPLEEKYLKAQRYGWDIVDEYVARVENLDWVYPKENILSRNAENPDPNS